VRRQIAQNGAGKKATDRRDAMLDRAVTCACCSSSQEHHPEASALPKVASKTCDEDFLSALAL
jgi:hypothetical protein